MEPTDLTIQILTSIRDELRDFKTTVHDDLQGLNRRVDGLNRRVDGLNDRVDGLNERVDGLNERVDRLHDRQVETELRLSTELIAVNHTVGMVADLLRANLRLRPTLDDHEERITQLEDTRAQTP